MPASDTAVLLIDAQESFLRAMHGSPEPLLLRLERLLRFARLLDLPVIATLERPLDEKGALFKAVAREKHLPFAMRSPRRGVRASPSPVRRPTSACC